MVFRLTQIFSSAPPEAAPRPAPAPAAIERHYIWVPGLKTVYARVPKAANSSIRALLLKHLTLTEAQLEGKYNSDGYWAGLPADQAQTMTAEQLRAHPEASAAWCFTFVREPFARLYSCWNNKVIENPTLSDRMQAMGIETGMPFADFVDRTLASDDGACDIHLRSQAAILTLDGAVVPDFVGRVERVDRQFARVRKKVMALSGVRLGRLPRRNVRGEAAPEVSTQFPVALRRKVLERYADDYRLFYPERVAALNAD